MESKFLDSRWIFKTKSSCHLRSTISSCWTNASCIQLCPLLLPLASCPSGGYQGTHSSVGSHQSSEWLESLSLTKKKKRYLDVLSALGPNLAGTHTARESGTWGWILDPTVDLCGSLAGHHILGLILFTCRMSGWDQTIDCLGPQNSKILRSVSL